MCCEIINDYLGETDSKLRVLTDSTLQKLGGITDLQLAELVPDFDADE